MQSLSAFFEDNKPLAFVIMFAALLVLIIVLFLLYRFIFGRRLKASSGGRARQPRLGVVDAFDLDRQRQLVLVRRDNVEHLIMIGGPNDVVVEASIVRTQSVASMSPARDKEGLSPASGTAPQIPTATPLSIPPLTPAPLPTSSLAPAMVPPAPSAAIDPGRAAIAPTSGSGPSTSVPPPAPFSSGDRSPARPTAEDMFRGAPGSSPPRPPAAPTPANQAPAAALPPRPAPAAPPLPRPALTPRPPSPAATSPLPPPHASPPSAAATDHAASHQGRPAEDVGQPTARRSAFAWRRHPGRASRRRAGQCASDRFGGRQPRTRAIVVVREPRGSTTDKGRRSPFCRSPFGTCAGEGAREPCFPGRGNGKAAGPPLPAPGRMNGRTKNDGDGVYASPDRVQLAISR